MSSGNPPGTGKCQNIEEYFKACSYYSGLARDANLSQKERGTAEAMLTMLKVNNQNFSKEIKVRSNEGYGAQGEHSGGGSGSGPSGNK